jgi:hypothetical protein
MSDTVVLRGPERPDLLRHEVLADIFEATAAAHPEQIALIEGQGERCASAAMRSWTPMPAAPRTG